MRRRNDATERVRSSSPPVAVAMVRRPRLRSPPGAFGVLGGVMILVGMPGRRMIRLALLSSSAAAGARAAGRAVAPAGRAAEAAVGLAVAVGCGAAGGGRPMWSRLRGRRDGSPAKTGAGV